MKIYYVSESEIPSYAANSVHVMKMCEALAKNGHEISLFCKAAPYFQSSNDDNDFSFYGVQDIFELHKCRVISARKIKQLLYIFYLSKRINVLPRPDLIYSRYLYYLYYHIKYSSMKVPIIYESHGPPNNNVKKHFEKALFSHPCFFRLVVISGVLKQMYLAIYPHLDETKIVVAHDGASMPVSNSSNSEINDKINSIRQDKRLQVGYVGSLFKGRGIQIIIELAKLLPGADFHIVGGISEDIISWKQKSPDNLYYHGFIPHSKVLSYVNKFDILLAPYEKQVYIRSGVDTSSWMSPLKIFEYMTSGKAIIASDLPVLKEVLENNVDALLVEPNDVGAWNSAINELLMDDAKRKRLGYNAKRKVEANYTWDIRAAKVLEDIKT